MNITELDTQIEALIDDLAGPSCCDEDSVGRLLTSPAPVVDDARLHHLLGSAARLRNLSDAILARLAAALERSGVAARDQESVVSLMTDVGVAPIVASRAARVGRALTNLPTLAAAAADARLSGEHAHAVVTGLDHIRRRVTLDAAQREHCVTGLLAQALSGVPHDVTAYAQQTAIALAPDDGSVPVAENRDLNEMSLSTGDDGRSKAALDVDVVAAEKLRVALDPLMTPVPEPDGSRDPRSTDQRRADAFEHILDSYLSSRDRPTSGGVVPHTIITRPADEVATVESGQPVSDSTANLISCDSHTTLIATDDNKVPLDIYQTDRFYPAVLRRALLARDKGCAHPGCGRPGAWCHAHHIQHWADGGQTTLNNGVMLCQKHHTQIHHTGWKIEVKNDGHPWFSPPVPEGRQRHWIRSHARRTMTISATAAA